MIPPPSPAAPLAHWAEAMWDDILDTMTTDRPVSSADYQLRVMAELWTRALLRTH